VAVLILSVVPEGPALSVGRLDKVAHLCEYLLFAWLLVQAVRASQPPAAPYRLWAWRYATSYGLLMELLQAMVPWRSAEWGDVAANAVGAALGVWVGK
jgi:VanZ family protein